MQYNKKYGSDYIVAKWKHARYNVTYVIGSIDNVKYDDNKSSKLEMRNNM